MPRSLRWWTQGLGLLFMAVCPGLLAAQMPVSCCAAIEVGPVVMTVADMDRSVAFYTQVLTFEKTGDSERSGAEYESLYGVQGARMRVVDLKLGAETLELQQFAGTAGAPVPSDAHSNDLSFQHVAIIVSDMDRAYAVLRQKQVPHISSYPQTLPSWNRNAAGIRAFYFKDPDGHPLEILQFPAGKGNPRWQHADGKLFLGIDHTAIVVSNSDVSLAFYRGLLGLHVAGESENYGFEQERLNNVFGAHLRITSLRGPHGIGVEFLEYLAPSDGRAVSNDDSAADLSHHETVVYLDDLVAFNTALQAMNYSHKSVKPIAVPGLLSHASQAELVRDPDGHFLLLLQR